MGPTGCRSLRLHMSIEFDDETPPMTIATTNDLASNWLGSNGPRIYDHEYHGEIFDAAFETPGWDSEPFPWNRSTILGWKIPRPVAPQDILDEVFEPMRLPPMRRTERLLPVDVWPVLLTPEDYTFHCPTPLLGGMALEGQNAPGAPPSYLSLECLPGSGVISKIAFANYGIPTLDRTCSQYNRSAGGRTGCSGSNNSLAVVERECVGKTSCSILVSNSAFGGDPCPDTLKRLAVVASGCMPKHPGTGKLTGNVSWVFDFGQNIAGTTTLSLPPQPTALAIAARHAERLQENRGFVANSYCSNSGTPPVEGDSCFSCGTYPGPNVTVYGGNCANQTWLYKAPARSHIDYTTNFSSAGFRYVELFGMPKEYKPLLSTPTLSADFIHTDVERSGTVELGIVSASPNGTPNVLNRIQNMVVYTARSELHSIPTDCPQRERRGWMGLLPESSRFVSVLTHGPLPAGDAHMSSYCQTLNNDMKSFYRHFLRLIRDDQQLGCETPVGHGGQGCSVAQSQRGSIPDVVPFTTGPYGGFPGSPVWQAAYVVIVRRSSRLRERK